MSKKLRVKCRREWEWRRLHRNRINRVDTLRSLARDEDIPILDFIEEAYNELFNPEKKGHLNPKTGLVLIQVLGHDSVLHLFNPQLYAIDDLLISGELAFREMADLSAKRAKASCLNDLRYHIGITGGSNNG